MEKEHKIIIGKMPLRKEEKSLIIAYQETTAPFITKSIES